MEIEHKFCGSKTARIVFEVIYLAAFAFCFIKDFFSTTMIACEWPVGYDEGLITFLIVYCIFYMVFLFLDRNIRIREFLFIIIIFLGFYLTYLNLEDEKMLMTALLMIGAAKQNYRDILKFYVAFAVPLIMFVLTKCYMGEVTNLIYYQIEHNYQARISFGFIYPTDFAAHFFYINAAWCLIRRFRISFVEMGIQAASALFILKYCEARISAMCILMLIAVSLYLKLTDRFGKKKHTSWSVLNRIFAAFIMIIPFVMVLLSRFYKKGTLFFDFVDEVINHRLEYGFIGFERYDTVWFGQKIVMVGDGGSTAVKDDYFFLDCSYVNIMLRFGWVLFFLIIAIFFACVYRNRKDTFLMLTLFLVFAHSAFEHHLAEYHYDIFLLIAPFIEIAAAAKKSDCSVKSVVFAFNNKPDMIE